MNILVWILCALVCALLAVIAVVIIRTFTFKPPVVSKDAKAFTPPPLPPKAAERLSKAIAIPTICAQTYSETNFASFESYNKFLQQEFPLFHQHTQLTRINQYGLVYLWKGTDENLLPLMLTAHYDVVPIEQGTEEDWKYPGFSGAEAEGRIWGRGTLDIKSQMTAQMEAAEALMRSGFVPKRSLYFVYGQDEEIGGMDGAFKISEYFEQQNIRLESVLDEGGLVVSGMLGGMQAPLAIVGVAEKGFCNFNITVPGKGGHSSTPPKYTALAEMGRLLHRISQNPMPARLTTPVLDMLKNISGEMGFIVRMAVANLWLFRPVLIKILLANPITAALLRTTFAPTMAQASNAANVLPQKASCTVNVRILPGDISDDVEMHIKKLVQNPDIIITRNQLEEASQISTTEGKPWEHLISLINQLYPNAVATPFLEVGGTDARKYYNVCNHVYRFTPIFITAEEQTTMHNTNEYISLENYSRMIYFYQTYINTYDE